MKILFICGSRDWSDFSRIRREIVTAQPNFVMIGDGGDADTYAGREARNLGIHVIDVEALWDFHGKRAGPLRNAAMSSLLAMFQKSGAEVVAVAFITTSNLQLSRGTADMVERLEKVNKITAEIIRGEN